MEPESILNFLSDLLDNSKSPQADAFNHVFNTMELINAYKMNLPQFMIDSPYKYLAQDLLSQYILKKPVENKHIAMFFSADASENVSEHLIDVHSTFTRFHKRK